MRHLIILCLVFSTMVSFGQNDSIGVLIPKDDSSPFSWETKHMWVGLKNPISSNYTGSQEFIRVWTDNGAIDSGDFYLTNYCVTPNKNGEVNVYSIQQIWTGTKYDTIKTTNTFIAIMRPTILLKVVNDNFKKDSTITISLIDSLTMKAVDKRYQIGQMYQPKIYDRRDNYIGELFNCFGAKIDLADEMNQKLNIASGYKMKIRLLIRDMKTDLLIPSNELVYTIK